MGNVSNSAEAEKEKSTAAVHSSPKLWYYADVFRGQN